MAIGRPVLYLIADRTFAGSDQGWLQNIERIVSSIDTSANPGTTILFQLRAKNVGKEERATLVAKGLEAAQPAGVPVLLNGSEEEARALGFSGVHWPEALIPLGSQHKRTMVLNDNFLRIAAVHDANATKEAEEAGADAVVFGPVFPPGSKPGPGVGLNALTRLVDGCSIPVIAIGGIDVANVRECLNAGAIGAAFVSSVSSPTIDTGSKIKELCVAMRSQAEH